MEMCQETLLYLGLTAKGTFVYFVLVTRRYLGLPGLTALATKMYPRLGGFGVCPFIDSACGREFFICSWRHSVGYWGQSSALYQTGRESQLSPHGQSHSFVFRLSKKQDTSKRFR